MNRSRSRWLAGLGVALLALSLTGCGINNIPTMDEAVKAAWGQVQNQYQRRADLIPNLVNTVKGYAEHERETLSAVTEARAKVGQMRLGADVIDNPEALRTFEQNQGALSSALESADGGGGALSGPQGEPELPFLAGAA